MIFGASQSLNQSSQGQNSTLVWQGREFILCSFAGNLLFEQPIVSKAELQSPGISIPKASLSWVFSECV